MRSNRVLAGLLLLLGLTTVLRFVGIGWMLPQLPEQDDFVATHVHLGRTGEQYADRRLSFSQYPYLLAHSVHLLPGPQTDPAELARMDSAQHRANASWDWLLVRGAVALWSLAAVLACFAIARRFLTPGWALFAAAFMPASLLLANFGQQGRPHGALAGLMALAVAAALRLRRDPSSLNFLLAGGAVFLATGCLHTAWLTLLPLAAAFALSRGEGRPWLDARALIGLAIVALSLPVFYLELMDPTPPPEALGHGGTPQNVITFGWVLRELGNNIDLDGTRRLVHILGSWEPALGVGVALALVVALQRVFARSRERADPARRADLLVVAAFVLPYLVVLMIFRKTTERYVIPMLPYAAVATAWALSELCARAGRRRALVQVAGGLLLCVSSAAALKLVWLRARPDTLSEAALLLAREVQPEGAEQIYLTPPMDLPLVRTPATLRLDPAHQPTHYGIWARYLAGLPPEALPAPRFDVEWLDAHAGMGDLDRVEDLAAFIDFYAPGWFVIEPERSQKHPWFARIRERVASQGTLVARLSPDGDALAHESGWTGQDRAYAYDDWPNNTLRILRLRAIGPLLEIYRIDGPR